MGGESHDGVVAFKPLTLGREAVMLGHVQVGEIMPTDGGRHQACFRLTLPEASTSAAWRPARDLADARRLALVKINDWLNAAGVVPEHGNAVTSGKSPWLDKLREPSMSARVLCLIESNAGLRVALETAIEVLVGMNDDEINVELLPQLKAALE